MAKMFYKAQKRIDLIRSFFGPKATLATRNQWRSNLTLAVLQGLRIYQRANRLLRSGHLGYLYFDEEMFGMVYLYRRMPGTQDFVPIGSLGIQYMKRIQKYHERATCLNKLPLEGDVIRIFRSELGWQCPAERAVELEEEKAMNERIEMLTKFLEEDTTSCDAQTPTQKEELSSNPIEVPTSD